MLKITVIDLDVWLTLVSWLKERRIERFRSLGLEASLYLSTYTADFIAKVWALLWCCESFIPRWNPHISEPPKPSSSHRAGRHICLQKAELCAFTLFNSRRYEIPHMHKIPPAVVMQSAVLIKATVPHFVSAFIRNGRLVISHRFPGWDWGSQCVGKLEVWGHTAMHTAEWTHGGGEWHLSWGMDGSGTEHSHKAVRPTVLWRGM